MSILTEFQTEQKQQSAKAARRMIRADLLDQKANEVASKPITKQFTEKKRDRMVESYRLAADANRMHGHQAADKAATFMMAAERHIPVVPEVTPETVVEPTNA